MKAVLQAGLVEDGNPGGRMAKRSSIACGAFSFSSIFEVEAALIETHELWRRSPGGGKWPFALDGPWHLIQGEPGDYGGEGVDGVADERTPRSPLDPPEVAKRDRMMELLYEIGEEQTRRCVWLGSMQLWRGEGRISWKRIALAIEWRRTTSALAWRYRKGLAEMMCAANRMPRRFIPKHAMEKRTLAPE